MSLSRCLVSALAFWTAVFVACDEGDAGSPGAPGGSAGAAGGRAGAAGTAATPTPQAGQGGATTDTPAGRVGSDPPPALPGEPCASYREGPDTAVCTASYLGGKGADRLAGADVAPDGSVVLGGNLIGVDLGAKAVALLGGGDGVVLRLAHDGRSVRSLTRLPDVTSIEVSPRDGAIAVGGAFGVAVLDAAAAKVVWSTTAVKDVAAISIGHDGVVGVLAAGTGYVFAPDGRQTGKVELGRSADVAVDATHALVVFGGDRQNDGGNCTQLRVPWLRGYGYDGKQAWSDWDYPDAVASMGSLCADGAIKNVQLGRDGELYVAAVTAGGNTIFGRDPKVFDKKSTMIVPDDFANAYGAHAENLTVFARVHPADGALDRAELLVARRPGDGVDHTRAGKGLDSLVPGGITADEHGNVYLAYGAGCCVANEYALKVNGQPVGIWGGAGVVVFSADFTRRRTWANFNAAIDDPLRDWAGSYAEFTAIAVGGGVAVLAGVARKAVLYADDAMTKPYAGRDLAVSAIQPQPTPGTEARDGNPGEHAGEGYYVVLPSAP